MGKVLDDEAIGKRDDVVETEDEERLNWFDRMLVLTRPDSLPLFDAATKAEMKANAKKAAKDKDEEPEPSKGEKDATGKVVPLKPTFEDEGASATA